MANERRLIDAGEIEELFYKQIEYGATDLMDAFDDALQDSQSVSAVEVVRCKDCCYARGFGGIKIERDEVGICKFTQMSVEPEEFCSHGEPRAEGKQ